MTEPGAFSAEWALVYVTLLLGILAPLLGTLVLNCYMRPRLDIYYRHEPPGAHKTRLDLVSKDGAIIGQYATYYFRFGVTNIGRMQAHRCEAVIEELWYANPQHGLKRLNSFGPTGLIWGAGYQDFVEIDLHGISSVIS